MDPAILRVIYLLLGEHLRLVEELNAAHGELRRYQGVSGFPTGKLCIVCGNEVFEKDRMKAEEMRSNANRLAHDDCWAQQEKNG